MRVSQNKYKHASYVSSNEGNGKKLLSQIKFEVHSLNEWYTMGLIVIVRIMWNMFYMFPVT